MMCIPFSKGNNPSYMGDMPHSLGGRFTAEVGSSNVNSDKE